MGSAWQQPTCSQIEARQNCLELLFPQTLGFTAWHSFNRVTFFWKLLTAHYFLFVIEVAWDKGTLVHVVFSVKKVHCAYHMY